MSKEKKQEQEEILCDIEDYMQENAVSDFSDLSVLLRLEHPEWYGTFVRHHAYFSTLIEAQKKKRLREGEPPYLLNAEIGDEDEDKAACAGGTVEIGKHSYNLDSPYGKNEYSNFMKRLVTSYPFAIHYDSAKKVYFVIENAGAVTAVCTDEYKARQCAEALSQKYPECFYDICWFEKETLNYMHFKK